jgi:hypothetical protein
LVQQDPLLPLATLPDARWILTRGVGLVSHRNEWMGPFVTVNSGEMCGLHESLLER